MGDLDLHVPPPSAHLKPRSPSTAKPLIFNRIYTAHLGATPHGTALKRFKILYGSENSLDRSFSVFFTIKLHLYPTCSALSIRSERFEFCGTFALIEFIRKPVG